MSAKLLVALLFLVTALGLCKGKLHAKVSSANGKNRLDSDDDDVEEFEGSDQLRVFTLNAWGASPAININERFAEIKKILENGNYDVVILQEVFNKEQFQTLKGAMPFAIRFEGKSCKGSFLKVGFDIQWGCSGLVIMSRTPIVDSSYCPFIDRGNFFLNFGEPVLLRGIGKASTIWNNYTVDIFDTHLATYLSNFNDSLSVRINQAVEMANAIAESDADIKLLGLDANAFPTDGVNSEAYHILTSELMDAMVARHPDAVSKNQFITDGHPGNPYSADEVPATIDFIMYGTRRHLCLNVDEFELIKHYDRNDNRFFLSDHEALEATFSIICCASLLK